MRSNYFLPSASQRLNSIRFPAKAAMQLVMMLFVLFLSLCLFPNLAAAASPHIYDAPNAGPPGSQTTVLGNGWDPNATIDIYLDSTDVGLVNTDNSGSFGMALKAPTVRQNGFAIQIPKDAVPGQHWITAVERISKIQAQVAFSVRTDWPQAHFDVEHTGYNLYENVLSPETVGNLKTLWKYQMGSGVQISPAVANGVVYTGSYAYWADNNLYALDANTGAVLWKYPASPVWYSAPTVVNGVVYYCGSGWDKDTLYALNANSGVLLWSDPLSCYSPPAVVNGVVYINSGWSISAIDAGTHQLLWKYAAGGNTFSQPAVVGGVVYFSTMDDESVYALDAGTGALLWKFATSGYVYDDPVVANGVVYVNSEDGYTYALNASTGALIWKYATGGGGGSQSPAVANGVVYTGAGYMPLYALDAGTGALLWTNASCNYDASSPTVANGVVYVGSEDGNICALNASTGAPLWKYPLGSTVWASPAVANGMLYVASDENATLYAFALPNQQKSEKLSPPERPDPTRLTPDWSLQPSQAVTNKSVKSK